MAEGESGASGGAIDRLEKGDTERTARHADVMNEIIDRLNSLLNATVSPPKIGKFIYSDTNVVLQLTDAKLLDLNVCIDGVEKVVTFLVKGTPRDPPA